MRNGCQRLAIIHSSLNMETNRQPESDEEKLCQQLEELLGAGPQLEQVTRAPDGLPRVQEPAPFAVPTARIHFARLDPHHAFPQSKNRTHGVVQTRRTGAVGRHDDGLPAKILSVAIAVHRRRCHAPAQHHRGAYPEAASVVAPQRLAAGVFSYKAAKEETILRSLLQLQLLIECVEILTPPLLTVKQIGGEEFDLIDDLRGFVRLLALLMWQRLAATGVDEQAYGALAACIAGLAEKEDDAMALD